MNMQDRNKPMQIIIIHTHTYNLLQYEYVSLLLFTTTRRSIFPRFRCRGWKTIAIDFGLSWNGHHVGDRLSPGLIVHCFFVCRRCHFTVGINFHQTKLCRILTVL